MDLYAYAKSIIALLFVLGLIALCAMLAKRYVLEKNFSGLIQKQDKKLKVIESLTLTPRHRMVVVEYHAKEYVLLLGASQETVVEVREKVAHV